MKKTKNYIVLFTVLALITLACASVHLSFHYAAIRQACLKQKLEVKQREVQSLVPVQNTQFQAGIPLQRSTKKMENGIPHTNTTLNFLCAYNTERLEERLVRPPHTENVQLHLEHLNLLLGLEAVLLTATIVALSFGVSQRMYQKYEEEVNIKIADLYTKVYKLSVGPPQTIPAKSPDKVKKRLISYVKDEIITIDTTCIAYIALVQHTISVCTTQNEAYNLNTSLDDLMKELDNDCFFRANRQYIININAIENIWVYGRNQLRIETKPKCTDPIIISKNKVSEFKKWLDQ
ncbi:MULTISPECIES: LytTR family DNA-binding domain-containing protein [unclassified Myroides]|uniref:LytTR family DNA-binding domain-containing protein n=1 Tax=unclassified Myroides TaxID=2642485 RepID=UPI003D2F6A76